MAWRKSSYSDEEVNCVEVAGIGADALAVRDSKLPGGAVLVVDREGWRLLCAMLGRRPSE
ncbi:DUF397 domain-containing protein [Actinomadura harenae]|uniref:DUF397 domain-containing protein n=1 Tax=Actinomadura harenae TaxID=2483351 RepID=A0A3M2M1B9_9ACTN|nr:DUF397 domain-containing protein [Actinomadura harenae]